MLLLCYQSFFLGKLVDVPRHQELAMEDEQFQPITITR